MRRNRFRAHKESILLRKTNTDCENIGITYRLYAVRKAQQTRFGISVKTERESSAEWLGTDLLHAVKIFQTLSQGQVLPCTLHDVLCDLRYLENF